MANPILEVFRFRKELTEPFAYLGAMWTIESKRADDGDHWECSTTAPLSLSLAIAENHEALRHDLLKSGVAALRNTERWYLLRHLESLGFVEQVRSSVNPNPPTG